MISTRQHSLSHGIHLSCRSTGTPGRPVLMFLHGFPEAAFVWDELLVHFARPENGGYHCIAPNMRGYENSSAPLEAAAYRPKHLVQDITALIRDVCGEGGKLACLVAHDWGGAVAWNVAAAHPELMAKLCIINAPHPGTFLRELQNSPEQQAASEYMNFLIRPDAEALLAENDFRRLWGFFKDISANDSAQTWLTDEVRDKYRAIWRSKPAGLTGPLNYYRASPMRPARPGPPHNDPAASAVKLPPELLTVKVPTQVIWATGDVALLPSLLDGLEDYIPDLQITRIEGATHWVIHEQPGKVATLLQRFVN